MTGNEFKAALAELDCSQVDFARELGVSDRTVRRWVDGGSPTYIDVLLRTAFRLHRLGLPWRKWSVAIDFNGPLSDYDAVIRHHAAMQERKVTIGHALTCPVGKPGFVADSTNGCCTCDFMNRLATQFQVM